MNKHEFLHEMAMIHMSLRRVLERLPSELFKNERKELVRIKEAVESFIVLPEELLNEKEK